MATKTFASHLAHSSGQSGAGLSWLTASCWLLAAGWLAWRQLPDSQAEGGSGLARERERESWIGGSEEIRQPFRREMRWVANLVLAVPVSCWQLAGEWQCAMGSVAPMATLKTRHAALHCDCTAMQWAALR